MVLATEASWYGMEMRPAGSGAGPTINDFRTFVTVEVRARGSITDPKGLVKMMRNEIGEALDGHDRKLARGLVSR